MLLATCIMLIYIACGLHNWGFTLGDFTWKFPCQNNTRAAIVMAILGPAGVLAVLCFSRDKHWRWHPLSTEERWKVFSSKYAILGREYFDREYR